MTKEIQKRTKVTPVKLMKLDGLAAMITVELDSAQKSFLRVGECLCHASDRLAEEGKKASDLIGWAEKNCGIKKAQMYKLMKVYETFGDNTDFAGVSMRVLYTLTAQNQDVVGACKVLALKGELDSTSLDRAIDNNKPEPKEPKVTPPVNKGKVIDSGSANKVDLAKNIDNDKTIKAMNTTIAELNKTIDTLTKQLAKKAPKKAEAVPTMPFLPQFKSKNMCVRLGLEGKDCKSVKAIDKAYRALAKIFTATTNKKASEALKEAREELKAAL